MDPSNDTFRETKDMTGTPSIGLVPFPPEDAQTRIERLERELKAAGRVNFLLQQAATGVVWNNEHLRAAIRKAVADLASTQSIVSDKTLADTAKSLDEALALEPLFSDLALAVEKAS